MGCFSPAHRAEPSTAAHKDSTRLQQDPSWKGRSKAKASSPHLGSELFPSLCQGDAHHTRLLGAVLPDGVLRLELAAEAFTVKDTVMVAVVLLFILRVARKVEEAALGAGHLCDALPSILRQHRGM